MQNLNSFEKSPEIQEVPEITHAVGEKAGLRIIDIKDTVDIERLWEIEQRPDLDYVGGAAKSKTEMIKFFRKNSDNKTTQIYAITGSEDGEGKRLPSEQHGEIEGWLRADSSSGEKDRYERVTGEKIPEGGPVVIEFAWLRRPDEQIPHGIVSSGVRQRCLQLLRDAVDNNKEPPIITAFIDKTNLDSVRVAEACGFVMKMETVSWSQEPETRNLDHLYIMDWDKLQSVVEGKTQPAIFEKISSMAQNGEKPEDLGVITSKEYPKR